MAYCVPLLMDQHDILITFLYKLQAGVENDIIIKVLKIVAKNTHKMKNRDEIG